MKERLQLAVEVRDAIEVVNSSSEYPKFIAAFMPALTAVLESTPAQLSMCLRAWWAPKYMLACDRAVYQDSLVV